MAAVEVKALARALAQLDVLADFAEIAVRQRYVRPEILPAGDPIVIEDGRHPVVEQQAGVEFIPNDTELNATESEIVLLTGPTWEASRPTCARWR